MAKQIRQYALAPPFVVETHRGAKVIGVRFTEGRALYVDMEVDPGNLVQKKCFSVLGVGQEVPDHIERYVGTVTIKENDGTYTLYVYEDKEDVFAELLRA